MINGVKPKIFIQIALLDNGELAFTSSSKNPATNVYLCEVAKDYFKGKMEEVEKPLIAKPRFEI